MVFSMQVKLSMGRLQTTMGKAGKQRAPDTGGHWDAEIPYHVMKS